MGTYAKTVGVEDAGTENLSSVLCALSSVQAAEAKLLLGTYDRYPLLFERGQGVHLIDDNGVRYLDLLSGIGVYALGYAHPAIEKAIT